METSENKNLWFQFVVWSLTIVGGKPTEYNARSPDLVSSTASNTSYQILWVRFHHQSFFRRPLSILSPIWFHSGETFYFDPNQLAPVLENRRYTFRASNDQIHVVDLITDQLGTSTKAYQIGNASGFKEMQKNPTVVPLAKQDFVVPSLDVRMDAASSKFVNQHQYRMNALLSHGFTSVLPAQAQFQHFFLPSSGPSMSIVVPFAVVYNPYAATSTSPSLIHSSERPIDPELINSIFQVPPNENKNNQNNPCGGGPSTSLQPPFYTSTPPPSSVGSTSKPPPSSTPYFNYFGTSGAPKRPNYLPPTENAVNNFDVRHLKFASTGKTPSNTERHHFLKLFSPLILSFYPEASPIVFNNRFLIDVNDAPSDSNVSVAKPSIELLPPIEA